MGIKFEEKDSVIKSVDGDGLRKSKSKYDEQAIVSKLKEMGYDAKIEDGVIKAQSRWNVHLLSRGWVRIDCRSDDVRIFYGTNASLLAWLSFFMYGLALIARALTIDSVNRRTYTDACKAVYGKEGTLQYDD